MVVIEPKPPVGLLKLLRLPGCPNCGVFVALKASARNCSEHFTEGKVLENGQIKVAKSGSAHLLWGTAQRGQISSARPEWQLAVEQRRLGSAIAGSCAVLRKGLLQEF